ncbi:hypothetical protein Gotur_003636 [Gossypium turneri]
MGEDRGICWFRYPNFRTKLHIVDNAIVRIWSEKVKLEKGDSLAKAYASELWDYTRINVTQNSLQELREIWDRWNDETKQLFYSNYGDLPYLFDIKVDE